MIDFAMDAEESNFINRLRSAIDKPISASAVSLVGMEQMVRQFDPLAEIMECGIADVIVFAEPNKFPEIAEAVYYRRAFGIRVRFFPRPYFLPDPKHMCGG